MFNEENLHQQLQHFQQHSQGPNGVHKYKQPTLPSNQDNGNIQQVGGMPASLHPQMMYSYSQAVNINPAMLSHQYMAPLHVEASEVRFLIIIICHRQWNGVVFSF